MVDGGVSEAVDGARRRWASSGCSTVRGMQRKIAPLGGGRFRVCIQRREMSKVVMPCAATFPVKTGIRLVADLSELPKAMSERWEGSSPTPAGQELQLGNASFCTPRIVQRGRTRSARPGLACDTEAPGRTEAPQKQRPAGKPSDTTYLTYIGSEPLSWLVKKLPHARECRLVQGRDRWREPRGESGRASFCAP